MLKPAPINYIKFIQDKMHCTVQTELILSADGDEERTRPETSPSFWRAYAYQALNAFKLKPLPISGKLT